MTDTHHRDPYASGTRSPRSQRALVWGACGFIGRHLVSRLLAEHATVTVLCGPVPSARRPAWQHAVTWLTVDRSNPSASVLERALSSADVVYNLAGTSHVMRSHQAPLACLDETCRPQLLFLEACAKRRAVPHVVLVSTRLVYAPTGKSPVTEDTPLDPRSLYAAHKLCVENYHRVAARRSCVTVAILRTSPVFGFDEAHELQPHGIVDIFIKQSLGGRAITLFGDGGQLRDFIYVDDLVEAMLAASAAPGAHNVIVNVGSGASIPLRTAAETVRALAGGPPIRYEPWPEEHAALESGDYVVDISKARAILNATPRVGFEEGIVLILEQMARRSRGAYRRSDPIPTSRGGSAACRS